MRVLVARRSGARAPSIACSRSCGLGDLGQQVDALEHDRRALRDGALDERVDARARGRGPGAGSRRPCRTGRRRRSAARRATSNEEWWTAGMKSWEKNARTTWRSWSVAITRVMPSRPASCVATVDLPTPVTPPSSTSSGRSSLRRLHHCRKRVDHLLALLGGQHLLGDRAQLARPRPRPRRRRSAGARSRARERERALGRKAGRHDRLGHQPLRVRQAVVAADDDGVARAARLTASPRARATAARRGASSSASRSGSPGDATRRGCAGRRPRTPSRSARSATMSIAAAFSSVRKTSQPLAHGLLEVALELRRGGRGCVDSRRDLDARAARARRADAARRPRAARS